MYIYMYYICSQKDAMCPPGYYQFTNGPIVIDARGLHISIKINVGTDEGNSQNEI